MRCKDINLDSPHWGNRQSHGSRNCVYSIAALLSPRRCCAIPWARGVTVEIRVKLVRASSLCSAPVDSWRRCAALLGSSRDSFQSRKVLEIIEQLITRRLIKNSTKKSPTPDRLSPLIISCLFFSASVRIISAGPLHGASTSRENDSSSDEADDESRLVPWIALPGVDVVTDELSVSSGCDLRGDEASSLWIIWNVSQM